MKKKSEKVKTFPGLVTGGSYSDGGDYFVTVRIRGHLGCYAPVIRIGDDAEVRLPERGLATEG